MGLGRYSQGGGLEATKWLLRHGAQIVITDLKDQQELKESVDVVMQWYETYRTQFPNRTIYQPLFILGKHREEDFVNADCIVQTPGVVSERQFAEAAKAKGIAVESDSSLFFRYFPHPVIAVTGTRYKTTATMLIGEMLKTLDAHAVIMGNVQTSPLAVLDDLAAASLPTPVVLEVSSWMLESLPQAFADLKKGPEIAVLTNMYPEHLGNRYANFEEYIRSKEILFAGQSPEQYAVLNYDHDDVRKLEAKVKGKLFWCSGTYQEKNGCFVKDGVVVFRRDGGETVLIPLNDVALKGDDNLQNILTAACAALLRGVTPEGVTNVLRSFTGVSVRMELVREVDEIAYVNDAAAQTVAGAMEAVAKFGAKRDVVLIAGGDGSEDVRQLAVAVVSGCQQLVLLPGTASDALESAVGSATPIVRAMDMKDAVAKARAAAERGDIVLLSPGAVTAKLWKDPFALGEAFREAVRTL